MRPGLLVLCVLVAWGARAQTIYAWVDDGGVEHFTDDPAAIPRRAQVRTTEGEGLSHLGAPARGPASPAPAPPAAASPDGAGAAALEDTWRRRFREARARVRTLEEEIEADRQLVEESSGLPTTGPYLCVPSGGWSLPPPGTSLQAAGGSLTFTAQPAPGVSVTGHAGATVPPPLSTTPCLYVSSPEYERLRERLARNRRELVRAREELADLERRAAFEAVPLHWRR